MAEVNKLETIKKKMRIVEKSFDKLNSKDKELFLYWFREGSSFN